MYKRQEHYLVYDGTITTCELPHPKWQFDALKVSVDVGGNAKIYRSNFLLHGIPILYFPFADVYKRQVLSRDTPNPD